MAEKMISIVIPVFNAGNTLGECLEHLFQSAYAHYEVIIVDDCSTDHSRDIARRYPCEIISLREQRGPAFARDQGAQRARGEIVAFLDSDCMAPRDWLSKINDRLTRDMAGIGGRYALPSDIPALNALFITYWDLKNVLYTKPVELISFSGGNCAFWRAVLLKNRVKREISYCNASVGGDDTMLCYELAHAGRLVYDPGLVVLHKKMSSLLVILKRTIGFGYNGAKVASVCGAALCGEPHRLFGIFFYICSLALGYSVVSLLVFHAGSRAAGYLLFLFVAAHVPVMVRAGRHFSPAPVVVLFPVVSMVMNLLYLAGHIKRGAHALGERFGAVWWNMRLAMRLLEPEGLYRLFFFVTKKCNASCYFCFNKEYEGRGVDSGDLTLEEIRRIASKAGFLPWLTLSGGEPFLRDDIYDICRAFYATAGTRIISIATNGAFTQHVTDTVERLMLTCRRLRLTVIVAVDDIGHRHDALKGFEGAHERALATLRRLRSLQSRFPGLTIGINTTIVTENAGRIKEILRHFRDTIAFDRQCLNMLRQKPFSGPDEGLIPLDQYLALMNTMSLPASGAQAGTLAHKFNCAALSIFCGRAYEEALCRKAISTCLAARKFYVLDNNGSLYPCELLREALGNLRQQDYALGRVRGSPAARAMRLRIRDTKCYCQWACAVASNGYFNLRSYPMILGRLWRRREQMSGEINAAGNTLRRSNGCAV